MDWKDLERMTVLKLREEALKYPQIEGVHGKNKEQLMQEIAKILGIEKPHAHFTDNVVHTKSDLKHKIRELKSERERLLDSHDHRKLHEVRRELHELKHTIRKIEAKAAKAAHA
ncbi:MAG: Rho termination protein [Acidobacteria bacterium]|nr:MAG: Rho termination protein [Acidobacteriota bacterium]